MKHIVIAVWFGVAAIAGLPSQAQEDTAKKAGGAAPVHLTESQWKAVQGVFQATANEDLYVRFTALDGGKLELRALWSGGRMLLLPQSELVFARAESDGEGPRQIIFHKDPATGEVNQVRLGNEIAWNRVKNYHPIERKEMTHTPEQLKPFEGLYRFKGGPDQYQYIQFTEKGNQLVLKQHWDNREIAFIPDSALHFFSREMPQFSLRFTREEDGRITQVLAFGRDLWLKEEKPQLAPALLKSYEGKYRSKDDPDNQLQLIARDGSIVVKQLWDGKEVVLTPMTDTYFYNEAGSYPMQIIKDANGKVNSILVLSADLFDKMPE